MREALGLGLGHCGWARLGAASRERENSDELKTAAHEYLTRSNGQRLLSLPPNGWRLSCGAQLECSQTGC
jgi:hypothetical protein